MDIEINTEKLTQPLEIGDIQFLPKQITAYNDSVYAMLIPYKNARVDRARLDDVCGMWWQNKYKRDSKGVLQCSIGIKFEGEWIWRSSNGVPSEFEKEKGEYSDAFKRAGFMWGIGVELYQYPRISITLNQDEYKITGDKAKATRKFNPNLWDWTIKKEEGGKIWVTAHQWFGQKKQPRFNSNPLESKNTR